MSALTDAAAGADLIVCGWGVHGAFRGRGAHVRALLAGRSLHCLALTKAGEPGHPLYLRGDVEPVALGRCEIEA